MDQKTILVVDDEPDLLELISGVLKGENFNVGLASSAAEAMAFIEHFNTDLIVCDVKMPKQSGFDLMSSIQEKGHIIPFVFMSGSDRQVYLSHAIRLGAADFLVKPFNLDQLAETVKAELEVKKRWDHILSLIKGYNEELSLQVKEELKRLTDYKLYKIKSEEEKFGLDQ